MMRALLRKNLADARWLLAAGAIVLFAFAWIRIIIVANMQTHQLSRIIDALPEMVKKLSPVPIEQLISHVGLIAFTFEEPVVYLIMAVWAIARGSDAVSGQLSQGTLEMVLAQPVSRAKYLLAHWIITLSGVLVLAATVYVGTWVGIQRTDVQVEQRSNWSLQFFPFGDLATQRVPAQVEYLPMRTFVDPQAFLPASVNYAALGFFFAGLTSAVSAVDRYRWRTVGLVVAFYVVQTVMELTGMAVDGWRWLLKLTIFAAYEPVAIVTDIDRGKVSPWSVLAPESHGLLPDLGPLGFDLVLIGLGAAGLLLAYVTFTRRDLPAPV